MTEQNENSVPTGRQLAAARAFVAEHGKPSKAVIEALGRAGVRVVLVGADGALGDVVLADRGAAETLVERVDDLETAEWDAATVNAVGIGPAHRHKMAGRR